VRTFIGTVDERPDAMVSGYLKPNGDLWALIYLDLGELLYISGTTIGAVTWI
jgi:hypothetical protein